MMSRYYLDGFGSEDELNELLASDVYLTIFGNAIIGIIRNWLHLIDFLQI